MLCVKALDRYQRRGGASASLSSSQSLNLSTAQCARGHVYRPRCETLSMAYSIYLRPIRASGHV